MPQQFALTADSPTDDAAAEAFLRSHRPLVVRPARGQPGEGTTLDVRTPAELGPDIERARAVHERVLLEAQAEGQALSVLVIQGRVVAAVERRPARVVGDGEANIGELVQKQARRREAASAGEASLPLDDEVRQHVAAAGHTLADVLPAGESLVLRRTAWLRSGASVHDVTASLHETLRIAAEQAARAADVPVVAVEMLVPACDRPDYTILALDAEPGLAWYQGQPCAERFLEFLFPGIRPAEEAARE